MGLSLRAIRGGETELRQLARLPGAFAALTLEGPAVLDLSTSWRVLHGLFTGSAWGGASPANLLLAGGQELNAWVGAGPARLVNASQTAAFAGFVSPLCPHALRRQVDPRRAALTQFYQGDDTDRPTRVELCAEVEDALPRLRAHLNEAAALRQALLMWMV
ncbi:MAG: DUF1877 family protein [Hyphomicrobiaceae bacterium]